MLNLRRKRRLRGPQHIHAGTQSQRIQLVQDKYSMTTLSAALFADEPITRALRRISELSTHNLHQ
jgi:hypothetical protein